MIENTKLLKKLFIELKNAIPNDCNVVINNLHLMFLFYTIFLKIELN